MRKLLLTLASVVLLLSEVRAQNDKGILETAARAMGADVLNSIAYSGSGFMYGFAQAPGPGEPWPLFIAKRYAVGADYQVQLLRVETVRLQGEHPPRGGLGQPIAGESDSTQVTTADAAAARLLPLWLTPHGAIKAAMANGAVASGRTLRFSTNGQELTVTLDSQNLVSRIDYMVDNPVLGDMPIEITYSAYRDYGGVKFPSRIVEKSDGYPTLDITISQVQANARVPMPAPPAVRPGAASGVQARQIAPGVWHLIASNYGSYAVEFADHLVMFEAPIDDARSMAVNAWVAKNIAGKPIRSVVNTHTHFDHAGGLRSYVADGVTIITHEMNKAYLEKVWARPRTIRPDRLSLSPKAPVWDAMTEKKVLTDGKRTLELHQIKDNGHHPYILMGYLPAERILLYGDMYNPPAGNDPRDLARTNEYAKGLYENILRLKLDVRTIAPIHGQPVPLDNLKKAIGM
jgi:glyoxylase-like metal-dependent hydrolase (beta-lactamase superfamily II)